MVCEKGKAMAMGMDGSGNTLAPSLTLNLDILLLKFPEANRNEEYKQATYVVIRNIQVLRQVYNYYCRLGHSRVQNTASLMTRLQFWRLIKDSRLHHHGHSLPEMDRTIARCLKKRHAHQPTDRLSVQEFLSALVIISHLIYRKKHTNNNIKSSKKTESRTNSRSSSSRQQTVLSKCVQSLISEHITKSAGMVKGHFLFDPRKAINALAYMERGWHLYRALATPYDEPPHERTLKMRRFLFGMKDLNVIGQHLQSQTVIELLAADDPAVNKDGNCNLEIEMTFLEFFEVLIGIAVTFVTQEMIDEFKARHGGPVIDKTRRNSQLNTGTSRPGSARPSSYVSRRSHRSRSSVQSIGEDDGASTSSGSDTSTIKSSQNPGSVKTSLDLPGVDDSSSVAESNSESSHIKLANVERDDKTASSWKHLFDDEEEENIEEKITISNKPDDAEARKREEEFNLWSSKLHLFFNFYLFPAWRRLELLQREATRNRR